MRFEVDISTVAAVRRVEELEDRMLYESAPKRARRVTEMDIGENVCRFNVAHDKGRAPKRCPHVTVVDEGLGDSSAKVEEVGDAVEKVEEEGVGEGEEEKEGVTDTECVWVSVAAGMEADAVNGVD